MKNGSKKDFYKWIDDIKKAYRHKSELEEKLKFYESRLVGYNAVTYDHIGSSSKKNNVESNLLFIIDKIDKTKSLILKQELILLDYCKFKNSLTEKQVVIIDYLVLTGLSIKAIGHNVQLSKSRVYFIINDIKRIYKSQDIDARLNLE